MIFRLQTPLFSTGGGQPLPGKGLLFVVASGSCPQTVINRHVYIMFIIRTLFLLNSLILLAISYQQAIVWLITPSYPQLSQPLLHPALAS
jgi:hypothetical protein